jgi:hypothetical protein
MNNKQDQQKPGFAENRELQGLALLFILYLVYLFVIGFEPHLNERFTIDTSSGEIRAAATETQGIVAKTTVISRATFDSEGFPVRPVSPARPDPARQFLTGHSEIRSFLEERLDSVEPEAVLKSYADRYGYYWQNPGSSEFLSQSRDMAEKMSQRAQQNRKLIEAMVSFLNSDAGKTVSTNLKKNLAEAIRSPARETLLKGFSEWKQGNLDLAYLMLQQAEAQDPDSVYIQIIAHHGMAVMNMERHGPLEETMRQYRHLAQESHSYISSFRPALEKAGFDPVKLYGRDPFDSSRLPSSDQLEKAMNESRYVQFEREYYKSHKTSPGGKLSTMKSETIKWMQERQRGMGGQP